MLLLLLLSARCRRANVLPPWFLFLGQSIGRMLGDCSLRSVVDVKETKLVVDAKESKLVYRLY
jgi:hypothetical protein